MTIDAQYQTVMMDSFCHSARQCFDAIARDANPPHVLLRPKFSRDGNMWCFLYGEDLQSGIAGFGETPAIAAGAFDAAWYTQKAG